MPMNELQVNAAALTVSAVQAEPLMFTATKPLKTTLRMYSEPGKFGTLRFDENGMFQFEGDASASAQVLFAEMKRLSGK